MAHDVFISYSQRDKAMADAACHALENHKIRCWYAPRDVASGAIWAEAIVDAIGSSRVFVLIFSDSSNRSPEVLREVVEAADRGLPIIPIRVENVVPTKAMAYYLKTIQWLDALTPESGPHLDHLVRRVRALLDVDTPAPPFPPQEQDVREASGAVPTSDVPVGIEAPTAGATTTSNIRPAVEPTTAVSPFAREVQVRSSRRPRALVLGLIGVTVVLLAAILGWELGRGRSWGYPADQAATEPPGPTQVVALASPGSPTKETVITKAPVAPSIAVEPSAPALPTAPTEAAASPTSLSSATTKASPLPLSSPTATGGTTTATTPEGRSWDKWTVTRSFASPGSGPTGVVRVRNTLWVIVPGNSRLYRLDLDGNIVAEFDISASQKVGAGLTWDGESLWWASWNRVTQFNPATGEEPTQFEADVDIAQGIAWDGTGLWLVDREGNLVQHERSGHRLRRLAVPVDAAGATGLVWVDGEIWVEDLLGRVERFDSGWNMLGSFKLSLCTGGGPFYSLALYWDGDALWLADQDGNRIYECRPVD